VEVVSFLDKTTGLFSSGSKPAKFSVFVGRIGNPVNASILTDGPVEGIYQNNLVELVRRILVNPIGVKDSQATTGTTNSLLGNTSQPSLILQLYNTMGFRLSINNTLGDRLLTSSTSNLYSVDNVSLLRLVTKTPSLVGTSRSSHTTDGRELSVLPATNTKKEAKRVSLLLLPEF
jgi:hypothetical protein